MNVDDGCFDNDDAAKAYGAPLAKDCSDDMCKGCNNCKPESEELRLKRRRIAAIAEDIHARSGRAGKWNKMRSAPDILCHVHAEVSLAMTAFEDGDDNKFKRQLASIVVRVFDMSERFGIDIEAEIMRATCRM